LVEVDKLTKQYGDVPAIMDVTFSAGEGEILGFLGKNGAGKTTTMRIMTGFLTPTAGTVRINGFDIREDSQDARRQIGYLPETAPLYEDMSVRGYLAFCARLREVPGREVAARVEAAMRSVNIWERRDWQIGKLSKGLRRRVGLAQALVHNPKVLILDEPTEGLDPEQIIEIRRLIQGLRGDHTVILSTHILPEAQALADRIVIIDQGRIVAVDSTENLTAAVRGAERIRIEADGPPDAVRDSLGAVPGVRSVEALEPDRALFIVEGDRDVDLRQGLAAAVVGSGWGLLELERQEPTLEEVFLQITGRAREGAPAPPAEAGAEPAESGAAAEPAEAAEAEETAEAAPADDPEASEA